MQLVNLPRVLVAGELNTDLILTGLPTLPQLGRELVGDGFKIALGSSSAIAAARLARLGAAVDFTGWIGGDDLGGSAVRLLAEFGVGVELVLVQPEAATGVTIALTYPHDRALLTYPGVMAEFDGSHITASLLARYNHLHVGSFYLQSALQQHLPHLFHLAHTAGLSTSLDTGWDPAGQWSANPYLAPTLAETDYFFPNEEEVTSLCGGNWEPARIAEKVHGLTLIKRGAKGALALNAAGESLECPALPVQVVDTTGAGDAFNAGFLYARLVVQADLLGALRFAAACGAQAVTQIGGATNAPSAEEVQTWLRTRSE